MTREEILAAERRLAIPVSVITIFAVVLFVVARFLLADATEADNDAELLRAIDQNQGQFMASYVIQAISVALLALPLTYLFRAAARRSDNVNRALIGAVIAGPVFLGIFFVIDGIVGMNAASDFVGMDFGPNADIEKIAEDAKPEQDLSSLAAGFSIAGALGLAAGMGYTCLQCLRIGLLSRFWGSLGIALGVTADLPVSLHDDVVCLSRPADLGPRARRTAAGLVGREAGPLAIARRADGRADEAARWGRG